MPSFPPHTFPTIFSPTTRLRPQFLQCCILLLSIRAHLKHIFKMRIYMTAVLSQLILALSVTAAPSEFPDTDGTIFSSTSITGDTTTTVPYANNTSVFCKRDGTSCDLETQRPQVNATGNWNDLDQPEIEDIDYFRFSSKNIIRSRADDWYVQQLPSASARSSQNDLLTYNSQRTLTCPN